jgi:FG-GAP-like repeat/ASPIC and UnbV
MQYLKKAPNANSFPDDWTRNEEGVSYFKKLIRSTNDPRQIRVLQLNLANQYLFAGENDSCIALVEAALKGESNIDTNSVESAVYYNLLALAYFRKGEVLNCQIHGGNASCILPFDSKAIYVETEPTIQAIYYYKKLLAFNPKDYISLWMLNIAYAALGQYPGKVPKQNFIDLAKYDDTGSLKAFTDIAPALGVATPSFYGGADVEDFNNDGLMDLFCCSFRSSDPVHLYINDGKGYFTDKTLSAGLSDIKGGVNSTHIDYDNDGYVDIFIVRGGWLQNAGIQPCTLLHNNGNGTFTDVTVEAGLLQYSPSHSASWADVNNDGWPDLFIAHEKWDEKTSQPSLLFLNNGNGTFSEASKESGIKVDDYVKGCSFGDINNDGLPDLYVSVYGGNNLLFLNEGVNSDSKPHFTEIGSTAGVQQPFYSFPCAIFDYDNDGWEDILCTGYSYLNYKIGAEYLNDSMALFPPKLYHNNHNNTFTDVTASMGLNRSIYAMGLNFADIDNDGYLDIYAATGGPDYRFLIPNLMFRNNEGRGFQDVTKVTATGHLQKGHAVSFGDIDNNGSTDLYLEVGGLYSGDRFRNALLYNNNNSNNWVGLQLVGVRANRSAVGARIKVVVTDSVGATHSFFRTVGTGASYGANSLQLNVGIGTYTKISYIEVFWPRDKHKQVFHDFLPDRFYKLTEDAKHPVLVNKQKVNFQLKYPQGVICN